MQKKESKQSQRKHLAFKLGFCDGGASESCIGFQAPCSDEVIHYNIRKAKRAWCSHNSCPCRQYYEGAISREELEAIGKEKALCYESIALSDWVTHAGMDVSGPNAGRPRALPKVEPGGLAILTTRYPGTAEEERVIVGIFAITDMTEADENTEGTLAAGSGWKIAFTPEQAEKLKFWNYYRNERKPELIRWGSGLYRYMQQDDVQRLLEDIGTGLPHPMCVPDAFLPQSPSTPHPLPDAQTVD